MANLHLRRRILKWGNAYGIRLTKKEAERLRVKPDSPVDVVIRSEAPRFDASQFHFARYGREASRRHTDAAAEAADAGR